MINKILFTIFVIVAIWKAFSFVSKLKKAQGASPPMNPKAPGQPSPEQSAKPSIELVPCRRCGSYVDPKEGCHCTNAA